MKLRDVRKLLNCQVVSGEDKLDLEISKSCASELMSNVLACIGRNTLLITGLNNIQVIRTAEISDVPAIIFVQGIQPPLELIELAEEKEIVVMVTKYSLFTVCGMLFESGLRSGFNE